MVVKWLTSNLGTVAEPGMDASKVVRIIYDHQTYGLRGHGTIALVSSPTNFAILFGVSPKANRKGGRRIRSMTTWKKLVHSNPMTTSRSGTCRGSTFHPFGENTAVATAMVIAQ